MMSFPYCFGRRSSPEVFSQLLNYAVTRPGPGGENLACTTAR